MASLSKELVKGIVGAVGKRDPDVPPPLTLYNEAAPRVIKALKQYDDAAPLIDFSTKNWWLLVLGLGVIAVGGSYLGNVLYQRVHGRRG